jgi:hypothetical protein
VPIIAPLRPQEQRLQISRVVNLLLERLQISRQHGHFLRPRSRVRDAQGFGKAVEPAVGIPEGGIPVDVPGEQPGRKGAALEEPSIRPRQAFANWRPMACHQQRYVQRQEALREINLVGDSRQGRESLQVLQTGQHLFRRELGVIEKGDVRPAGDSVDPDADQPFEQGAAACHEPCDAMTGD